MSQQIEEFAQRFNDFKTENLLLISRLSGLVDKALDEDTGASDFASDMDDLLDDCAAEIKTKLGADATNHSGDSEIDQEEAINQAENWVTDNISNSSMDDRVAGVLWLLGIEDGAGRVNALIDKANESVSVQLVLNVKYRLNGESAQWIREALERMVYSAIGNGLLTGDSPVTVDEYDLKTKFSDEDTED